MCQGEAGCGESPIVGNSYFHSTLEAESDSPIIVSYHPHACHGFSIENVYDLSQGRLHTELKTSTAHIRHPQSPEPNLPLSCDHLIVLIHYNVWRACLSNLLMVGLVHLLNTDCELVTSRVPTRPIPPNLFPTCLQQHVPHRSWIDIFPDPKLRDNMILAQGQYDEKALFNDLIGGVCTGTGTRPASAESIPPGVLENEKERNGLLVWSQPWDINSWEATPGFLNRWGMLSEGCEEFTAASNRWRRQRGEDPLEDVYGCLRGA